MALDQKSRLKFFEIFKEDLREGRFGMVFHEKIWSEKLVMKTLIKQRDSNPSHPRTQETGIGNQVFLPGRKEIWSGKFVLENLIFRFFTLRDGIGMRVVLRRKGLNSKLVPGW